MGVDAHKVVIVCGGGMLVVSVFVYLKQDLDLRIFGCLSVNPGTTGTSTLGVLRGELDGAALSASHAAVTAGRRPQAGGGWDPLQALLVAAALPRGEPGLVRCSRCSIFKLSAPLQWRLSRPMLNHDPVC